MAKKNSLTGVKQKNKLKIKFHENKSITLCSEPLILRRFSLRKGSSNAILIATYENVEQNVCLKKEKHKR